MIATNELRAGRETVTVAHGLAGIEEEWAELAERLEAPPSGHPGYARAWLEAYAHPARLVAGVVRRDGAMVALAPLVDGGTTLSGMPESEEVLVLADDPGDARAAVTALLRLPVGRVRLRPVAVGEETHEALRHGAVEAGARIRERVVEHHPVLEIEGTWEDYLAAFPSKVRGGLRRGRRLLDQCGEVSIEALAGDDALGVLDEALAIEASGWKGRSGTALAVHEADGRFYRGLAEWAAGRGWLRLRFLRLDGRAVAFALELEAYGVRYGLKTGYDESLARVSPGRLVIASCIEDAFRSGCVRYDFTGPARPHTARWTDDRRHVAEITIHPRSPRGDRAHLVDSAQRGLRAAARAARDRIRPRRASA